MNNNKRIIVIMTMALLMMLIMTSAVFADSWTDHERISVQTGEAVYIEWDSSTSSTGTLYSTLGTYYPDTFLLWVGDGDEPTVTNGSVDYLYETQTTINSVTVTNKAYEITLTGQGEIEVTLSNNNTYTIYNEAPYGNAPSAALPTDFNHYLPIGQFATGTGWGSIVSGDSYKFLNGYCSTGVSLGAAGGFVDYDFRVSNLSSHKYGIDFIIYGNAFSGNPEAGAVKVYGYEDENDTNGAWYSLAGSKYFDKVVTDSNTQAMSASSTVSKNNKDVYWKLVVSNDTSTKGIWYQVVSKNGTPASDGWTRFTSNYNWWPFENTAANIANKGYESINGISGAFSDDDLSVNSDKTQIVYKNVDLVEDTDTTNDYQFGYFDVHINGSNYGTAINPYTATNTSQGGDGFDLSWAVNEYGEPVSLDHISKVRLYTSAAMNNTGTAFTVPSIFGETSAEICGIYGVNGSGSADYDPVTVAYDNDSSHNKTPGHLDYETISVPTNSDSIALTFTSSADNLYVNGKKINSGNTITFDLGTKNYKYVQIISQSGTSSPHVTYIKVTR